MTVLHPHVVRAALGLAGSALVATATVALGAAATGATDDPRLTGETVTLDAAGGWAGCAPGVPSYDVDLGGSATGPWPGPVSAHVSTRVEDGVVTLRLTTTTVTASGTVTATGSVTRPADDRGVCVPVQPGQQLAYTAALPGDRTDAGTAAVSGTDDRPVLTDTSSLPAPAPDPSPDPSSSPSPTDPPAPDPTPSPTTEPGSLPTGGPTGSPIGTPAPPGSVDPDITFGYRVTLDHDRVSGTCTVDGHAAGLPVHVVCVDVTGYVRHGDRVDFRGHATVDGAPTTYRVRAVDHADPGAGQDSFLIRTGTGWAGGGMLVDGDLRVR